MEQQGIDANKVIDQLLNQIKQLNLQVAVMQAQTEEREVSGNAAELKPGKSD